MYALSVKLQFSGKMHICMSSQQKNLVYALWEEVPKLVYAFWTCKPVGTYYEMHMATICTHYSMCIDLQCPTS